MLKWLGIILAGVIVLLLIFAGYVYFKSASMLSKTYTHIQGKNIYVPNDSATVARGEHLVHCIAGCAGCHNPDLGGYSQDMMPFMMFNTSNITFGKGGLPADYTIEDLDLIVRHAVKRDKTGVFIMPSYHYNRMADKDVAAIYAYLKTATKVDKESPALELGPIGRMVLSQGGLIALPEVTDHSYKPPLEVAPSATPQYGKYLAEVACIGCHGPKYSGGPLFQGDPSWPPASNLSTTLKKYTQESFQAFLLTGIRPDGTIVDTVAMPIRDLKHADSLEVSALWQYLSALPREETGKATWLKEAGIEE
ncbi:cytochrome c [bacterium]|nr:cytochrome c [bacterium]